MRSIALWCLLYKLTYVTEMLLFIMLLLSLHINISPLKYLTNSQVRSWAVEIQDRVNAGCRKKKKTKKRSSGKWWPGVCVKNHISWNASPLLWMHIHVRGANPQPMVLIASALPLHDADLLFLISSLRYIIYKLKRVTYVKV